MKRFAPLCLSGFLAAGLVACTGTGSATALPAPPASAPAPAATAAAASASAPAVTITASSARSAATVAASYYRAVVARNYKRAFSYLARGATGLDGKRLTLQSYLQLARTFDGEGGAVTSFSVGGFPAQIVMTVTRQRYGPYHVHLRMTRVKGGWAIASLDRI